MRNSSFGETVFILLNSSPVVVQLVCQLAVDAGAAAEGAAGVVDGPTVDAVPEERDEGKK